MGDDIIVSVPRRTTRKFRGCAAVSSASSQTQVNANHVTRSEPVEPDVVPQQPRRARTLLEVGCPVESELSMPYRTLNVVGAVLIVTVKF